MSFDFSFTHFDRPVAFAGFLFAGRIAKFTSATFSVGLTGFRSATSEEHASFEKATFLREARFDSAKFLGYSTFAFAKFKHRHYLFIYLFSFRCNFARRVGAACAR
jgi:hypothetical protein